MKSKLKIESIRLNPHYVIWYKSVATVLVSLLIPLCLLAFWNWNIYVVLMRRQRLRNRPFPNKHPSDQYINSSSSSEERGGLASHSVISTIPATMAVAFLNQSVFGAGITRQSSSQQGMKLKFQF